MSNQKNLYSPFEGEIIPLQDVKDPIFSEKTMGDGYAVEPTGETIYAPVSGTVRMVQGHAAGFSTADDLQVLLHIGIDTVSLDKAVFEFTIKEEEAVKAGQVIGRVNWKAVEDAGLEKTAIVVITNTAEKLKSMTISASGKVKGGSPIGKALAKGIEIKTKVPQAKKKKKFALGGFFQELGKTFMLPVALMAFMGLLLGLGSSFSSQSTIDAFPFLGNEVLQVVFRFFSAIGGFAFSNLPVMFAMAIPLGLAKKEKGVAAFSGFVGYMVMNLSINFFLTERGQLADPELMQKAGQGMALGVQTIEMGVLGGIITGIIVYNLHKKFYNIQLSDSFAFFGGSRFVPIITALVMALVGLAIPVIWPLFALLIQQVGNLIPLVGAFWFAAYYFTFKKVILWKNLKTPGREAVLEPEYSEQEIAHGGNTSGYNAEAILAALGGKENIVTLDNCITRLRLILNDGDLVEDDKLKDLGALGVVHLDDTSVQVIIGTKVTTVRNALDNLI